MKLFNIKEATNELVEEVFALDEKITSKERILDSCGDNTRHLHIKDLKRYQKTFNRKMQLLKITRG